MFFLSVSQGHRLKQCFYVDFFGTLVFPNVTKIESSGKCLNINNYLMINGVYFENFQCLVVIYLWTDYMRKVI